MEYKVKLQPFQTPNYVIMATSPGKREDGWKEAPKFHISTLDKEDLIKLCDEFKENVLKKAGKN